MDQKGSPRTIRKKSFGKPREKSQRTGGTVGRRQDHGNGGNWTEASRKGPENALTVKKKVIGGLLGKEGGGWGGVGREGSERRMCEQLTHDYSTVLKKRRGKGERIPLKEGAEGGTSESRGKNEMSQFKKIRGNEENALFWSGVKQGGPRDYRGGEGDWETMGY